MSEIEMLVQTTRRLSLLVLICIFVLIGAIACQVALALGWFPEAGHSYNAELNSSELRLWHPPDSADIPANAEGDLIRYGRKLIENTAEYLGPRGKIRASSNGMNCQNCHLAGGTKPFAANYSAVATAYPKFRKRSGTIEGFEKRVNDCFQRSLNGQALEEDSREMKAIVSYLKWLGKDVTSGKKPEGSGLYSLPLLNRAADPDAGNKVYARQCATCHGKEGEGMKEKNLIEWKYPPLWGPDSYNTGAGLYRISMLAAFVRANMPYGIDFQNPLLTNEEAWDVAAFVNSMPRPHKDFSHDWPNLRDKPMDHPFGPYADNYPEKLHKYGPFKMILSGGKK